MEHKDRVPGNEGYRGKKALKSSQMAARVVGDSSYLQCVKSKRLLQQLRAKVVQLVSTGTRAPQNRSKHFSLPKLALMALGIFTVFFNLKHYCAINR